MRMAVLVALVLSGCQSAPSFKAADCYRFRHKGYNVLACDDMSVGIHCKRVARVADNGKPVNYHPRACHVQRGFGRKANIFVGKSYMACLPHEICHEENPWEPAMCEQKYPCVGDK
jgi:hypothetical protein